MAGSHPRSRNWSADSLPRLHCRSSSLALHRNGKAKLVEPEVGLEPTHSRLQGECSTTELLRRSAHGRQARCCLIWTRPSRCSRQAEGMEHPKTIGDRSQAAITLALIDAGYTIFLPVGENSRCDLLIDDGDELRRVQCKTGRLRRGAVRFSACSNYAHHRSPRAPQRDYLGEIDCFAVYCPETKGVYLVPIADVPVHRWGALRVDPPLNGQKRGIRPARDYEIASVAVRTTAALAGRPGAGGSCA
jgi:hypothetical protein